MRFSTLLAAIPFVCAEHTSTRLFHRIYHPTEAQSTFLERGSVVISENNVVSFQPSSSYAQDLVAFAETLRAIPDGAGLALYQVALERERDTAQKQWDVSSVKVCHLHRVTSEVIYLHTLDTQSVKPYAIDYFVSPIPHEGTCPKPRSEKMNSSGKQSPFDSLSENRLNTTVVVQGPRYPPLPELTTPPPLTAEGGPIVPVPEKSLLQKYWMYILIVLLALLMTGGGEDEQRRK